MRHEEIRRGDNAHIVWLNAQTHIASFHPVDGYTKRSFSNRDFFLLFLHALQERGYRFQ